jgi:ATP-dependent DNA helicase PIF1
MYEPLPEDEVLYDPATVVDLPTDGAPALMPTAEQAKAMDVLADQLFVNVNGTAGTGKTVLAQLFAERELGVIRCATTGIAAVNLGEGSTINSALNYYDTQSLRDNYVGGFLQATLRRLRRAGVRKILLDEKSMLDAFQLTYITRAIDDVNQGKRLEAVGEGDEAAEEADRDAPPPMGLILLGDFGQLPPVKAPFAFESAEWPRYAEHTVKLSTILRQTDQDFIRAIHYVRQGRINDALTWFTDAKFEPVMDERFDGTTIFAKNDSVDRYNQLRLDACPGRPVSFEATRWGKQSSEWKQIPEHLNLKVGALAMILANRRYPKDDPDDQPGLMYCNGDLGEIVDAQAQVAQVRLKRTGHVVPVQRVTRDFLIPLDPGRRKELREAGTPELIKDRWEIAGQITYMPLRLAWGTTVHKSQGLSLDQVQINIRDHFFGAPSMLFVALSRARTPQGLRIVGNQRTFIARCAVNPAVVKHL